MEWYWWVAIGVVALVLLSMWISSMNSSAKQARLEQLAEANQKLLQGSGIPSGSLWNNVRMRGGATTCGM